MSEPITDPDTQNESISYWNDVLRSHGLSMERGKATHKTSLRGGLNELVVAEEIQYKRDTGKVEPKGHGPEKD